MSIGAGDDPTIDLPERLDSSPKTNKKGVRSSAVFGGSATSSRRGKQTKGSSRSGRTSTRSVTPVSSARTHTQRLRTRLLGALACGVGAGLIGWGAVCTVWGQGVDTLALEAVLTTFPGGRAFGKVMTTLVSPWALPLLTLIVLAVTIVRGRVNLAGRAMGMVVAANVTTQVYKFLLERPDLGVTTHLPNSLPSGHVTVGTSMCVALIIVAPAGMRGIVAWVAWAWASLSGIAVMVSAWHRPADALVAILVTGAWALLLTPLETRPRRVPLMRKVFFILVVVCAALAVIGSALALIGLDLFAVSTPGASGYGFAEYVEQSPVRARVLSVSSILAIVALAGAVTSAVDRLCQE